MDIDDEDEEAESGNTDYSLRRFLGMLQYEVCGEINWPTVENAGAVVRERLANALAKSRTLRHYWPDEDYRVERYDVRFERLGASLWPLVIRRSAVEQLADLSEDEPG